MDKHTHRNNTDEMRRRILGRNRMSMRIRRRNNQFDYIEIVKIDLPSSSIGVELLGVVLGVAEDDDDDDDVVLGEAAEAVANELFEVVEVDVDVNVVLTLRLRFELEVMLGLLLLLLLLADEYNGRAVETNEKFCPSKDDNCEL